MISLGDKKKRGRPHNLVGALSGPKTLSLSNNPASVISKQVVIDNLVGCIVGYSKKEWVVRFPLALDENDDIITKNFSEKKILSGLEKHRVLFGGI